MAAVLAYPSTAPTEELLGRCWWIDTTKVLLRFQDGMSKRKPTGVPSGIAGLTCCRFRLSSALNTCSVVAGTSGAEYTGMGRYLLTKASYSLAVMVPSCTICAAAANSGERPGGSFFCALGSAWLTSFSVLATTGLLLEIISEASPSKSNAPCPVDILLARSSCGVKSTALPVAASMYLTKVSLGKYLALCRRW